MSETLIYQCDYWWRGRKYAHLTYLTRCHRHNLPTHHVGTIRLLGRADNDGGTA